MKEQKKILITLITLIIIIPISPLFLNAQENVTFEEYFADNRNDWLVDEDEDMMTKIQNGKFIFEHKREESGYYTWNFIDIDQDKDFIIETTMKHLSGANDYGYGLVWGLKDIDNYFAFEISDNGLYRVTKNEGDDWEALVGWTESDHIYTYDGTNKLSIKKSDNQLKFYINDNYVDQTPFERFFGNAIGYVIWRNQKIEIDNLIIKEVSQSGIIFEEYFADNRNDWLVDENEDIMTKIQNGKFIFEHKREESGYYTLNLIDIDQDKDFSIETTLQHLSGENDYGYGLVWGLEDIYNYFSFEIANTGFYRITKKVNGNFETLVGWTDSDHIYTYGETNKLSIKKSGNQLKFYINDNYVAQTSFERFFGNAIGYVIWKNQTIEIDNLIIKEISTSLKAESEVDFMALTKELLKDVQIDDQYAGQDFIQVSDMYWDQAESVFKQDRYLDAAQLYKKSCKAEILSQNPRLAELAITLRQVAHCYSKLEQQDNALEYLECALAINKDINIIDEILITQSSIGNIYLDLEQIDKAGKYYNEGFAFALLHEKDEWAMSFLESMGLMGYFIDPESSFYYFEKALEIARKLEKTEKIIDYLKSLGGLYFSIHGMDDLDGASIYFDEAKSLEEQLKE